ncbi:MAG: winged helix-turn-helix domain-containing protein [Acidobacteriota bacterium]
MSLGGTSNNLQNNFKCPKLTDSNVYEFENFRLDSGTLMLYRSGVLVPLTRKVVETLTALVERSGQVVSKEELMEVLWSQTSVEESNLSQNLYLLRKTLGNREDGQPFIETYRRRGYRFNAEISHSQGTNHFVKNLEIEKPEVKFEQLGTTSRRINSKKRILLARSLVSAAVLATLFLYPKFFQIAAKTEPATDAPAGIKMTRLTPDQNVYSQAISPDGKYLAFDLFERGEHGLWLKELASGSSTQIMAPDALAYCDLEFSPNGLQIYYGKTLNNHPNVTVFRIPIFGGNSQLVAYNRISPLTLSPDGRQIGFMRNVESENRLIVADADGSSERILSRRRKTSLYETWGSDLSWSPDGNSIAACGAELVGGKWRRQLIEVSTRDGVEHVIPTPDWNSMDDVAWLSDQKSLVVRARETEVSPWQIWRISYPDGNTNRITDDMNDYDNLSLSADSQSLVVSQTLGNFNLWAMRLGDPHRAKQLTFSAAVSANDGIFGVSILPNGKIVYTSPRDGHIDLWQMDLDGGGQKQLTKHVGDFNGRPRTSPDGRSIVFVSSRSGSLQIWRMDADGNNQRQLSFGEGADHPWISPDGDWIYCTFYESAKQLIAKIPFNGGSPTIVFEEHNPYHPSISPNGKLMYFDDYDENSDQPWKHGVLSLESGETLKEFSSSEGSFMEGWANSMSAIVARDNRRNLWVLPMDGRKSKPLTDFENGQIRNFAVSPDLKQIVLAHGNPSAEAMLITNF